MNRSTLSWVLAAAVLAGATGFGCSSANDAEPGTSARDTQPPTSVSLDALPVEERGDPITDERAAAYLTAIAADGRMAAFLMRHPVARVVIRHSDDPDFDLILLVLTEPADDSEWPLQFIDVCAIEHPPGITGVIWSALNASLTRDVSPRWSEIDCMGSMEF